MELLVAIAFIVLLLSRFREQDSGAGIPAAPNDSGTQAGTYGPTGSIDDLTEAWARFEGFYKPNSLAQRNNNPVNVKGNWPGVVGHTPSGLAIFDDVGDGWDAATAWSRRTALQHPDWSFSQFFAKVLGDLSGNSVNNDQGNSENEAEYVANYLGVDPGTNVSSYFGVND